MTNGTDRIGRWTDHCGRSGPTLGKVTAAFRQQADEHIVDRAAALFARHGFAQTSVQSVADAVGLSKAGLLHHFPSKQALWDAVLVHAGALGQQACDAVAGLPPGSARDLRAVEVLADIALAHPGLVALLLTPATRGEDATATDLDVGSDAALRAFGVEPLTAEPERLVRVLGALAALAVVSLAAHQGGHGAAWRSHVIATSFDALGHARPRPVPDPGEA